MMMSSRISTAPVTLELCDIDTDSFAIFGVVKDVPKDGGRCAIPTRLIHAAAQGNATLGIITVQNIADFEASKPKIERHPFSVQVFIPLGNAPLIPVVAPAGLERPRAQDFHAFRAKVGQYIAYGEGTWHLGMVCDGPPMAVAVFIHRLPDGSDTQNHTLDADIIFDRKASHD
jgi:ureidoglycolate hydrolase